MKKSDLIFRIGLIIFFCALLFIQVSKLLGFSESTADFILGFGVGVEIVGVLMIVGGAVMKHKEKTK